MGGPSLSALYVWLEGCDPEHLAPARLEQLLRDAVSAGDFTLFHVASGGREARAWALAVVGESHLVLHADLRDRSLCAEVLSCSTEQAARRALDSVRRAVPHVESRDQLISYAGGAFKRAAGSTR